MKSCAGITEKSVQKAAQKCGELCVKWTELGHEVKG